MDSVDTVVGGMTPLSGFSPVNSSECPLRIPTRRVSYHGHIQRRTRIRPTPAKRLHPNSDISTPCNNLQFGYITVTSKHWLSHVT